MKGGGWGWGSRGGGGCGLEGGVEEIVVVGLATKRSAESDGEWWHVDVEEALVGAIGGATRPKGGWAEVQELAVEGFGCI